MCQCPSKCPIRKWKGSGHLSAPHFSIFRQHPHPPTIIKSNRDICQDLLDNSPFITIYRSIDFYLGLTLAMESVYLNLRALSIALYWVLGENECQKYKKERASEV